MKKKILLICLAIATVALSYPVASNYIKQEHLLFLFSPLDADHQFSLPNKYDEKIFELSDGAKIHCLKMEVKDAKGAVIYYHGQGVNIQTKGKVVARLFNNRGYDVYMIDYRGFGKSRGIMSEKALYSDCLIPYKWALEKYNESDIVLYGCSLGTSMASFVASKTKPRMLILESPYYNMIDLGKYTKPYLPSLVIQGILKYPMRTDLFLETVTSPIHIFHGTADTTIPYSSSLKLMSKFTEHKEITLTTVDGGEHNTITKTVTYHQKLDQLLD